MAGWINGYTLPNGYALYEKGYATLSTSLMYALQRHISLMKTATYNCLMVPLPPAPSQTPPILPISNTNPSQAGSAFGIRGSVILTNLNIIQWDIFWLYQSMFTITMVIFLIPTEHDLPEGYVSYCALSIPWLTGYLYNYIGFFPYQHGYITLE